MKLIIIGGGASGLMLASILNNKKANIDITIIEKEDHVGKKILLSGNGRCNLSNTNLTPNCYNNEFGYNIANSFDTISYFNSIGLLTTTDSENRAYPLSNVSNNVLDVLRKSISDALIINNEAINRINIVNNQYELISSNFNYYYADFLVIAAGGKTYYKECNSYTLANMLSHKVCLLRPSLTYLKVKENLASIENLRCKVKASLFANNILLYEDFGEVLFKKDAISGIVIFQLSSIIARNHYMSYVIKLDLAYNYTIEQLCNYINKFKSLDGMFAKMINQYILKNAKSNNTLDIAYTIKNLSFNVIEPVDFKNAQVTSGGVDVNELNENLESVLHKNLYFSGEIINVDGICGGYNLQFAFASANKIANDIILKVGVKNEENLWVYLY